VRRKNWMGTIIKPPPTPRRPEVKPTNAPVTRRIVKYVNNSIKSFPN